MQPAARYLLPPPHVHLSADSSHARRPDSHDGGPAAGGSGRGTGVARRRRRYGAVHGWPSGHDPAHQSHLVVRRPLPVRVADPRGPVGAQRGASLGARGRRSRAGPRAAHAPPAPWRASAAEHAAPATLEPESTAPSLTVTPPTARAPLCANAHARHPPGSTRSKGARGGAAALGEQRKAAVRPARAAGPSRDGLNLATEATIATEYGEGRADAHRHIVAYDYGM